jgi:hypothetical protein
VGTQVYASAHSLFLLLPPTPLANMEGQHEQPCHKVETKKGALEEQEEEGKGIM